MEENDFFKVQRFITRLAATEQEALEIVRGLGRVNWHVLYASAHQQEHVEGIQSKRARRKPAEERDARIQELRAMPYGDYLQTPEWQETRRLALLRATFRCQTCNKSKELNVHHRTYERLGRERQGDIIVLCDGCHELFHKNGKLAK